MSRLKDRQHRHDVFFKKARAQGFAARAVFKLEEIDRRHGLLRPGQRVVDLGAAPGSWLQYVAGRVGERGRAVGVDLNPIALVLPEQATFLCGDAFAMPPATLREALGGPAHVVLSDMAPKTTGVRFTDQAQSENLFERALHLALELLVPQGHFLGKLFQGGGFADLRRQMAAAFEEVKVVKPPASRKESYEIYLLGLRRKASPRADLGAPAGMTPG